MSNAQTIPLIIDGQDVRLESHEREFEVHSASQGQVVAIAQGATKELAIRAVETAAKAFPLWAKVKPSEKRAILNRFAEVIASHEDELKRAMMGETSCTDAYASHNVKESIGVVLETAALATTQSLEGTIPYTSVDQCLPLVFTEPLGVILGIAPWNAPLILGIRAMMGPLIAGNTVVLKGSELSPETHYLMIRYLHEAGLPPGVVNLVQHRAEDASEINTAMIAHHAVRKINFTGSTRVGSIIAAAAGKYLKPTLMELGGKGPMIVLEDADLEKAAHAGAFAAFNFNGQICMSTERLIVVDKIADEFVRHLLVAIKNLPAAIGKYSVTEKSAEKVHALIDDALAKGASLPTNNLSTIRDGAAMTPSVVRHVTPEMELYHTESFGPCVGIIEVKDADEAIRVANDSFYGLSSSIFSKDHGTAIALAKRMDAGAVHINAPTLHDEPTLPHGGVKDSGFGRFGGRWGVMEFVKTKSVMVHGVAI